MVRAEVLPSGAAAAASFSPLRPELVPPTPVFNAWPAAPNGSVTLAGRSQEVAEGAVMWDPPLNVTARFAVLPAVVTPAEVAAILALVRGTELEFDADPDTVDGMATHEIFVEDPQGLGVSGGLKRDSNPADLAGKVLT